MSRSNLLSYEPPDELCAKVAELFRTCSARLVKARMALYPTCYRDMMETYCRWHALHHRKAPPYQTIRNTELGHKLARLDLFEHMHGTIAYAAWTVATLIYMQANRHVSEIIVPFGKNEEERAKYRHSLIYLLELPYAAIHMRGVPIRDFYSDRLVGSDEILACHRTDLADFMAGTPCDLDVAWKGKRDQEFPPEVTRPQRDFFAHLFQRYAALDYV